MPWSAEMKIRLVIGLFENLCILAGQVPSLYNGEARGKFVLYTVRIYKKTNNGQFYYIRPLQQG